ncbi:hypothetical protein MFLAVUS_009505 [Mucor flavus]|uniref:Uncharacterized protein n=1 Tax=Mucor flavus TaxID=439312 RepID=A0ABP9ZA85_9FUNG
MATDAALNLLATSAVTCAQAEATSDLTDNEIMIHTIAHKKLSDKLSVEDLTFLQNYESDGSPKSDLFLLSVKLLKKEKLSALEEELLVIEDTELWRSNCDEQEFTYYRRFASILDVLFKDSEVVLADGETGCISSRIAIEANKCIFNGEDVSPSYSRKIDLLLKYDENEFIELCSNE